MDGADESRFAATAPRLRTEVDLDGEVERARLHVAGLGYGELYVNGEKVGDAVLDPAWTCYDSRVLYATHDVTDLLSAGTNALGLWLGRGWFAKNDYDWTGFGSPRARLHLTVEYADGRTRTVGTDGSWRAHESPVVENDVYDGEVYDARREQPGWAEPDFDDDGWAAAAEVRAPGGELSPQRCDPIRVVEKRSPESVDEVDGGYVVDFGQNLTGWVELTVRGAERGRVVELAHAEALDDDGDLLTVDLREADATDTYVAGGDAVETYAPRFTYHGFRYARVDGYPGDLDPADLVATVVHTDLDRIGEFACSNDDLEDVQHNAVWGLRGDAHSVPTDCPQRNERLPWTGDGHLAARALMYNFDAGAVHEKWMRDHDDAQAAPGHLPQTAPSANSHAPADTTWPVTRVVVPWYLYCHYGDRRALADHYEAMRRYVDYWHAVAEGGLVPEAYSVYGDWLALENNDGSFGLPRTLFTNAYHYRATDVVTRAADALGNEADAHRLRERAGETRAAFTDRFFDPETATYGPGTQASYAVPLSLGLVPDDREDDVAAGLAETVRADGAKLQTGFPGTPALLAALTDHGYADLAYEVVSRPERPGWVYEARQGATTVWERWDSDDRVGSGMNSLNHSPFTLVSAWFYRALAGIRLDEGFGADRRVDLRPAFVSDLDWAAGSVETPCGEVATRRERTGEGVRYAVTVPWNATGAVDLPTGASVEPAAGGDLAAVDGVRDVADGGTSLALAPGEYAFRVAVE